MTIIDIILFIIAFTLIIAFILSMLSFKQKKTKEIDDLYNYCVKNEYDKQDIYKRIAELEEKTK